MIFSNTEIDTVLRCQRKAVLSSKNGEHLTPLFSPLSLETGSIVHRAHHLWLQDTTNQRSLEDHTMDAACEAQEKAVARYVKTVGAEPEDIELATLYESIDFCRSMARNYELYYGAGNKLPAGWALIKPEQKIRIKIPGTQHYLEGRVDALIADENGDVGLLERKTYKQRSDIKHLRRNQQFIRYSWLVAQLGFGSTWKPAFVLYDGLWRRHEPPKGKKLPDLFNRYKLQPTHDQLREFARYLPMIANQMAFMYRHTELAYPTIPWLGCNDCEFNKGQAELCDAITANNTSMISFFKDTKFTQRVDDADEAIKS